ncbi:hypothetical protein Tco_0279665, partial [Tanacetum coccineum]
EEYEDDETEDGPVDYPMDGGDNGDDDDGDSSRDTWVDPAKVIPEVAPITVGEVNTRVTELAELHEHDTQDLSFRPIMIIRDPSLGTPDTATIAGYSHTNTTSETLRVIRDMRREISDMQAELLALREQQRRAR